MNARQHRKANRNFIMGAKPLIIQTLMRLLMVDNDAPLNSRLRRKLLVAGLVISYLGHLQVTQKGKDLIYGRLYADL